MILAVKIVEVVEDNYQGGSGDIITRDILVTIPDDTPLKNVPELAQKAAQDTDVNIHLWGVQNKPYHNTAVISISILTQPDNINTKEKIKKEVS